VSPLLALKADCVGPPCDRSRQFRNAMPKVRRGVNHRIALSSRKKWALAVFLCGDDACDITGTPIAIDGGWLAYS